MKIKESVIEEASLILNDGPTDNKKWTRGSCCKIINVHDNWSLKVYKSKALREYTWNIQNIAHRNKRWEKTYKTEKLGTVFIKTNPGHYDYEEPLSPMPGQWIDSDKSYGYLTETADTTALQNEEDKTKMINRLRQIGLYSTKDEIEKQENSGYVNNRLVCIDFDVIVIHVLIFGGLLQQVVGKTLVANDPQNNSMCTIDPEIKQILNWKSE